MSAAAPSSAAPPLSAALRSFETEWRARAGDPIAAVRSEAMQRCLRLGLPTTRDESWRYTNLRWLAAQSYAAARRGADLPAPAIAGIPGIVIANGYPELADAADRPTRGVEVRSLRQLVQTDADWVMRRLRPLSDSEHQRWALLNTALFADGLHVKIGSGSNATLLLTHVADGGAQSAAVHPRMIIESAPGSAATIIEYHVSGSGGDVLTNSVSQIFLAEAAELRHYRVFATGAGSSHVDTLEIRQDKDSRCTQFTICVGGGFVRTTLEAQLRQSGAVLDSYALLVGHEARHLDCVNAAVHAAPNTRSRQTARAIASGTSRVIFNSKVIVNPGATAAESQQSCRGLLLAPTAEIDTRPQLEIRTDEVKCAHGATTGRLDPDMLFYMLSRGIDRATAQSLLVYAFLADVFTGMSVAEARAAIETALIAQLPDAERVRAFR